MNLPTLKTTDEFTDCLFVGGPLHDQVREIPDYADAVFVHGEDALMAVDEETSHFSISPPDYVRHDEGNVFRHNTVTENEADDFAALRDGTAVGSPPEAGSVVLDYVAGMRDACQAILDRFVCPHCSQQYA